MKALIKSLVRSLTLLTLAVSFYGNAGAQTEPVYGNSVPIRVWTSTDLANQDRLYSYPWQMELTGTFASSYPGANDGVVNYAAYQPSPISGQFETIKYDFGTRRVPLYQSCYVQINATWLLSSKICVTAPPGYQVSITATDNYNGGTQIPGSSSTWFYVNGNQDVASNLIVQITVTPKPSPIVAPVGKASSLVPGKFEWHVSLGSDQDGESAGEIVLFDPAEDPNWDGSSLFNLGNLSINSRAGNMPWWTVASPYHPSDGLLHYFYQPASGTGEAIVDMTILSSTAYEIAFYHPSQMSWSNNNQTLQILGDPYVKYHLGKGTTDGSLVITQETRNVVDLNTTGLAVATRRTTSVTRSGTYPDIKWEVLDWANEGAVTAIKHVSQGSGTATDRSYANNTRYVGDQIAWESTVGYHSSAWGEAITSRTVGGAAGTASAYSYYSDASVPMQYGRPQTKTNNDGGWESYVYAEGGAYTNSSDENSFYSGLVRQVNRPWQNSPSVPTSDVTQGECIQYYYELDPFGYPTRPGEMVRYINGVMVQRTDRGYAPGGKLGKLDLVKAVRRDAEGTAKALNTITLYFREDTGDVFFRNKVHSIAYADGTKTSYVYEKGAWDGSSFAPQIASNGYYYGYSSRMVTIHGTVASGDAYTTYGDYDIDDLHLVSGKSTMEVAIRNDYARLIRTEQHVWKDGAWHLIGYTNFTYNFAGRLTQKADSTGAVVDYTYNGLDLASEKDASGTTTTFGYDDFGRLETKTQTAAGLITALTTKYEYDAASRVTAEKVGWGLTEKLVSTRGYNTAGLVTSEAAPGVAATSHSYNIPNRTHTATRPDNNTVIETKYRDGTSASITGTGLVASYSEQSVDSNGLITTVTKIGSSTSPRWKKVTKDWLDRVVKTEQPAIYGLTTIIEEHFYQDSTGANPGKLYKSTHTGSAPTRYEYDATGDLVRSGTDFGDNGLVLASNDRITDLKQQYVQDLSGGWWKQSETWNYPTLGSGTAKRVSLVSTRLSGFSANRLSEVKTTDGEGNVTTETVDVSRSTATTTHTVTRTGLTQHDQKDVSVNGLSTSSTSHDGLSSSITYDALHRIWKTKDSRDNTTTVAYYSGTGFTSSITDATNHVVSTKGYDTSGRLAWSGDALNNYTYIDYTARGELWRQWGAGATPVEYSYDTTYGDRTTMKTYRTGSNWSGITWPTGATPDTTTWTFDPSTGVVTDKKDAANHKVSFAFNERNQLHTVTRPQSAGVNLVTTYGYFDATGELHTISYSDSTPSISYGDAPEGAVSSYTRLGQPLTVTDATGTRDFVYDSDRPWRLSTEALDVFYNSRVLTQLYDSTNVFGRGRGFQLGSSTDTAADLEQSITFTTGGRVDTLTSKAGGANARVFTYSYKPNSALLGGITVDNADYTMARTYEDQRNLLSSIEYKWGTTVQTGYAFTSNTKGQRETTRQYGSAFSDYGASTYQRFGYDSRGELTAATAYLGEDPTQVDASKRLPSRIFEYNYDPIGNRRSANQTGVPALANSYTPNALNQYDSRENNTLSFSGTAAASAKVALSGATSLAARQGSFWADEKVVNNVNGPWTGDVTVFATTGNTARTQPVTAQLPSAQQSFSYDYSGNLTSDGLWDYKFDAENRLIRMETTTTARTAGIAHRVLTFTYDYLSRRVAKRVTDGGTGQEILSRRYLYAGWNLVAEFAAPGGTSLGSLRRSYTWGLDIAGSSSATGGVGALLQIADHPSGKRYLTAYDGNGNVAALLNASTGAVAAVYEYDPFGNSLRNEVVDTTLDGQPYRFSTKYLDSETGLAYYGYRYYSPSLGRFINRDPIEEKGGMNLYGFCVNDAVNGFDVLGNESTIVLPGDTIPSNGRGWSWPQEAIASGRNTIGGLWGFVPSYAMVGFPTTYQPPTQESQNYQNQKNAGWSVRAPGTEEHPANKAKMSLKDQIEKDIAEGKTVVYVRSDGSGVMVKDGQVYSIAPNNTATVVYDPNAKGGDTLRPVDMVFQNGLLSSADGSAIKLPKFSVTAKKGDGGDDWLGTSNWFVGGAGVLAGGVENIQNGSMGFWIGRNLTSYSTRWGGNGATGGRLAFAGKMAGTAKTVGNAFGVLGITISGAQAYQAYKAHDGDKMFQAGADMTMGGVGFLGPIGWAGSTGYFGGQLIDKWTGFSDVLAGNISLIIE